MNSMKNKLVAGVAICMLGMLTGCSNTDGEKGGKGDSSGTTSMAAHPDSAAAGTATFILKKGRFSTDLHVPGELIAFQQVDLYAKVSSFVKKLYTDVGSEVRGMGRSGR